MKKPKNSLYKFLIGKPISNPLIIDQYKVVINNMHGDADGTTYDEVFFTQKEEVQLSQLINFLKWCREDHPDRDDIEKMASQLFSQSPDEDEEYCDRPEWLHGDHTADHQFVCRPTLESLTYFDSQGVEHQVTLK